MPLKKEGKISVSLLSRGIISAVREKPELKHLQSYSTLSIFPAWPFGFWAFPVSSSVHWAAGHWELEVSEQ